jgi:hypothetical protein
MTLVPEDMATAIEKEMAQAWQDVKGSHMPPSDPDDRRPMFLAISRGVLEYLQQNLATPPGGATQVGTATLVPTTVPTLGSPTTYNLLSLSVDVQ